jgi:Flp pilus assembly protein TadD
VREFQKVLQGDPKNLKAQANLAGTFLAMHRYSEASDAFGRAVALSPDDPDLRTNLAIALQNMGRVDEAKQALAEAKRLRLASTAKSGPTKN